MRYPEKSYYDTLGVPRNASDSQIKTAYREQIKFFHPDVFQGSPEIARQKSQELNEAYSVLTDREKRADYDVWLRMKDAQEAQARQKAEEEAREAEERRREAEEQERKKREEAEKRERQKAEEAEDWRNRKEKWEKAEKEWNADQARRSEEKASAEAEQKRKQNRTVQIALSVCLIASIAAGIAAYSKTQATLLETQAQLDQTQAALLQLEEDSSSMQALCNYYKRAEECCSYLFDTFDDMYSVTPIFTTFGDAESFRNSVRERIESDLSLVEDCYEQCADLEITTYDDLALLRDVQGLCEKAFMYLNRLESEGKQAETVVSADASNNTMNAITVMYTARSFYWNLTNPE